MLTFCIKEKNLTSLLGIPYAKYAWQSVDKISKEIRASKECSPEEEKIQKLVKRMPII